MKQVLTAMNHLVTIAGKAGHVGLGDAMAAESRAEAAVQEREGGLRSQIEVHSIDWIPDTERHGKTWQQTMLWFLGNFQYFTIPIGFVGPSLGLSLGWSILAGVLGIWFGTLFMAFHATQGPVFGLPQMIQTRAQLGYRGVVVALFAVLFTYMAFNVADQVLMASGLHGAFGWSAGAVAIITAVLAAALAIFGYDWVHRVFRFLLVISFPCYAIISVAILAGHAGGVTPHHPGSFIFTAFMAQFSVAAAYNITYAPYVSDYSRYMPRKTSPRGIIAAVFFGASGSAIWLIALGAWLATRLGVSDGLVGLQRVGDNVAAPLGSITAFLSATALLATMGMNAYGGMLTVLTGIDSFKKIQTSRIWRAATVVVLAVIWYAIGAGISTSASDTAVSAVLNSLTLMLYLLVPWTALNLVDFFFVRHGHYAITDIFRPDGAYGVWGWRGLTAYFAGFAAEIPFMVLPPIAGLSYTGPFPAHLTNGVDYSWLVGLVISGLVYLLLSRSLDVAAEASAINASERELRAIDAVAGAKG
jgi:NCS1 family nucleobase:cation symporter-1